jgi:oxygen-independent coproporphyrinogen-3 oxidase
MTKSKVALYIHIPFCQARCYYCDFFSSTYGSEIRDKYVDELANEIKLLSIKYSDRIVTTVYLGGGTPSLLSLENLEKITNNIYENFNCSIEEFTIEVNPNSAQNLPCYKNFGIDRISIGIQSLNNEILHKIGRLHDSSTAITALELASKNYKKISGDLILGINENQKVVDDAQLLINYVNHLSVYMLKVEKGTILERQILSNKISIASEDSVVTQYNDLYDFCLKNNFNRYETSNFAIKGYESKHNSHYWDMSDYIGIGAGAYSFVDGNRYYNIKDIPLYIKGTHSGNNKQIIEREYSKNDTIEEYIMLALRTEKGLNIENFNNKFNMDFLSNYNEKIKKVAQYCNIEKDYISIKPQFCLVQNTIISDLL